MKIQLNKLSFFAIDIIIISLSFYISFLLRFDFKLPYTISNELPNYLPIILISKLSSFLFLDYIEACGVTQVYLI